MAGGQTHSGSSGSGTTGGTNAGGSSAAGAATGGSPANAGSGGSSAAGAATGGSPASAGGGSLAGSGGSGDACAGALVCDDFEKYTGKPGAPWTVSTNNGTVAIDTTKFRSGKQSVKFSTTGANTYQRAYIGLEGAPFPVANNAFYGRMMIYATSAANDGVHWTMIQAEGPVAAQGVTNAQVRYGGQQMKSLMANYDSTGKKSDCWKHSATKMPEGQWACMQWYFDGKTNTQKFWLNGKAIDDLTVVGEGSGCLDHDLNDTWYFPQDFSKAYVGWESYQKDDAREIWIDDVAIGTQALACPSGT
ncbi:MAG TPA: hypothetical protein VHM25_26695 [Polyangiaceae bacterium]|nr:hypothetical protein [Polyangiaceae bacterium]